MARKKTTGIVKVGDREYSIDKIIVVDGRRYHLRKSGFSSVNEAKLAMEALAKSKRESIKPMAGQKRFDDLVEEYEAFRSMKVKSQTLIGIRYIIQKHVLPHFSGLTVTDALAVDNVRAWYISKAGSTVDSQQTKNNVFAVMRQIIDRAWRWHYIDAVTFQDLDDLVQSVKRAPKRTKNDAIWTYEQERQFLGCIPHDTADYPMFSLFCYLGCRIGEFQGLQWKCFDPKSATIVIGQQVVREGGTWKLTSELKTNESYRINHLDADTLSLLLKYRSSLNSSKDDEFIFPSPRSSREPLSRTEFRRRFEAYIQKSGVPRIVIHGVRKSKATMIAGVCHNAEEVAVGAKFLGHSASMFMGTYVSSQGVDQNSLIGRLSAKQGT